MAEAVMRDMVVKNNLHGWEIDSAGTAGYHVGERPHDGTLKTLTDYGVSHQGIRSRKISIDDFDKFHYIVAMDESNLQDLKIFRDSNESKTNLLLLSDFIENCEWKSVPDPWYTGNFEQTYKLVYEGCNAMLKKLNP